MDYMILKYYNALKIILFSHLFFASIGGLAQKLNVVDETSKKRGNKIAMKVLANRSSGHAILCFDSSIPDLEIISNANDSTWIEETPNSKRTFMDIDLSEHKIDTMGVIIVKSPPRYRELILRSPNTEDYLLCTPELTPSVYYYSVILPDKFPVTLSMEYIFSVHHSHRISTNITTGTASWSTTSHVKGFRISYGGRYGLYFSYK